MTRYTRFHVTGGLFHVISRFHDRRFYLDIEGARDKYLELLGNAALTHDSRIIAYCLMSVTSGLKVSHFQREQRDPVIHYMQC